MKSTGLVRRVDDLGRVVIPKEIRRHFRIREGDPLEIFMSEDGVIFKKYNTTASVKSCLDDLAEAICVEDYLKHGNEMLQKIKEIEALLKAEQDDIDKGTEKWKSK